MATTLESYKTIIRGITTARLRKFLADKERPTKRRNLIYAELLRRRYE